MFKLYVDMHNTMQVKNSAGKKTAELNALINTSHAKDQTENTSSTRLEVQAETAF